MRSDARLIARSERRKSGPAHERRVFEGLGYRNRGYLGSLLAPLLLKKGYDLIGVNTGFYKTGWLYNGTPQTPRTLNKDIRQITAEDLAGVEAIVHMAELSNDPTGELAPNITYDINHKGSVRLARMAKEAELVALFICPPAVFMA